MKNARRNLVQASNGMTRQALQAAQYIEFTGRGVLSDNQKPGLFARFWNWIWPF